MVAVAIGGAALIGGATSIISGNKAAKAQKQAAEQAGENAEESLALQKYMYDTTRGDYAPAREVGQGALYKLADMYGVPRAAAPATGGVAGQVGGSATPATPMTPGYAGFQASPGYQFRVDEAMKAIERSAAARGGLRSGATMDALQRRVQGVASSEYENYANRLASLAGVGQSATSGTAAAGANYASGANAALNAGSNAALAAGNARASGYANTGNAINQGVQNLASAYLYTQGYGGGGGGFGGGSGGAPWFERG